MNHKHSSPLSDFHDGIRIFHYKKREILGILTLNSLGVL
jgi:hypothetical protein